MTCVCVLMTLCIVWVFQTIVRGYYSPRGDLMISRLPLYYLASCCYSEWKEVTRVLHGLSCKTVVHLDVGSREGSRDGSRDGGYSYIECSSLAGFTFTDTTKLFSHNYN